MQSGEGLGTRVVAKPRERRLLAQPREADRRRRQDYVEQGRRAASHPKISRIHERPLEDRGFCRLEDSVMVARMETMTVNTFGFNVPCRRFLITVNVTRDRRMPLVDEFYLRVLKLCERAPVRRLGAYFGFSQSEMDVVTNDLAARSLIELDGDYPGRNRRSDT